MSKARIEDFQIWSSWRSGLHWPCRDAYCPQRPLACPPTARSEASKLANSPHAESYLLQRTTGNRTKQMFEVHRIYSNSHQSGIACFPATHQTPPQASSTAPPLFHLTKTMHTTLDHINCAFLLAFDSPLHLSSNGPHDWRGKVCHCRSGSTYPQRFSDDRSTKALNDSRNSKQSNMNLLTDSGQLMKKKCSLNTVVSISTVLVIGKYSVLGNARIWGNLHLDP
jgi:hypothetical protein